MDLPRIASHTSICQTATNIQMLTDFQSRVPASKRLLSASVPQEPQFAMLPSASNYQPSRRREEARTMQNLRRRMQALRVVHANRQESIEQATRSSNREDAVSEQQLDNRPHLLQKILTNRPVSMVLDISDLRTAWQDSDFITDCLCWHNVYRQRHSSPALTMSSELCHLAQTWANHLAHTNRFYYRNDKDIGQNLLCRQSNSLQNDVSGQEVASYWYSAVRQYDYGKEPDVLHANVNAGHFTQLVWASSKYFGVGKARSRSGKVLVVAHYAPAGNTSGAYKYNVLPPVMDCPALPQLPPPRFIISSESTETDSTGTSNST
ncbi:Cysteine-rich secretory protein family [Popillia japonica]|uniref:Cysteine-rich secretory protein family n=1 Tax=Popillia japonica TaxID=7064 RepID=A0AAW1JFB6_POPJA